MGTTEPSRRVFRFRTAGVLLLLWVFTAISYWPLFHNGFITLDDTDYLTRNPHVTQGLTWRGFLWAFQSGYACNWHPLTWLSHMLDCQLFGLSPLGHHFVSLVLHIAVTLLLFQFLRQTTGSLWRSAIVAAFFALHPLHVESVAWASERKDVLSAFFFLLTLIAYAAYARRNFESQKSNPETPNQKSEIRNHKFRCNFPASNFYLLALALFALALMAKPMVVTLPFVLLLLDFWPLGRITPDSAEFKRSARGLIVEKIPFFLLSIGDGIATYLAQNHGGAVKNLHFVPLTSRMANIFVSYVRYLAKVFWPADLTPVYPYHPHWPVALVIGCALLIALVSALACLLARRFPYCFTGWFWFLGMLVPVIGLIQVGREAMADRYMYLPSIGLFIAAIWGARDAFGVRRTTALLLVIAPAGPSAPNQSSRRTWFAPALCLIPSLALCASGTFSQVKIWRNSETLFARAAALYPHEADSLSGLGAALAAAGRNREALPLLTEAVRIDPSLVDAQLNCASVLMGLGRSAEAVAPLENVARLLPTRADSRLNLGCAYFNVGRTAEAETCFDRAVELDPENPEAHYNLSMALLRQSKSDRAIRELSTAVRLDPSYVINTASQSSRDAVLHYYLGTVLLMQSHDREGVEELSLALRVDPNLRAAHRNLALVFKNRGQLDDAIRHFSEAVRVSPESIDDRLDLAGVLLKTGRTAEALTHLNAALALAPNDPAIHCRLADAEARNHQSDQAIAHYREALRLNPDLPEARHELAALLNR